MLGMKYIEAPASTIEEYLVDDRWSLSQKLDGARCLVHVERDGSIDFRTVADRPLRFAAAAQWLGRIRPMFARLTGPLVVDGELMIETGEFWAFDLPYAPGLNVTPASPYFERKIALGSLEIPQVPVAFVEEAKRDLWDRVMAQGSEGVIARRLSGPYEIGRRVDHVRKIKMVKTADVVVTWIDKPDHRTGSIAFGCYAEDGELYPLGACSAVGRPYVEPGSVIEVRYLYRPPGGALVQPRMVRPREDKEPRDCTFEQFPEYSRAVIL